MYYNVLLSLYILIIQLTAALDDSVIEKLSVAQNEELDKKLTTDNLDSVLGESLYETELDFTEEEEHAQEHEEEHEEENISAEDTEEKMDYQDTEMQIILSDVENYRMWEDYKRYVDEAVLIGLQDATLCR